MSEISECPRPFGGEGGKISGSPRTSVQGCSECSLLFQTDDNGNRLKDKEGHYIKCPAYYSADRIRIHGGEQVVDEQLKNPIEGTQKPSQFETIWNRLKPSRT